MADVTSSQLVRPGALVALKVAVTNAASFATGDLTYAWNQTAGPKVTLSTANTASASFQAPPSTVDVTYTFNITVKSASNPNADPTNSTKLVNILSSSKNLDVVTIDTYTWTSQNGGTISVTAHSSVIDGSVTRMNLTLLNPTAGAVISMGSQGGGKFSYSASKTKQPSNGIAIISNFGGNTTRTTLSAKRRRQWQSLI